MKRTFSTALALVTVLLGSTLAGAAAASTARLSAAANAERGFQIDMATNRAVLKVSAAALSQAEKRASRLITPCLTRELVQVSDQTQSNRNANKALEVLSEEAGAEWEMAAIRPVLRPLLNGIGRLLTLKLPHATRATAKGLLTAFTKIQSLNACSDARTWLAAGLTPAQEPRATTQLTVTLKAFHKLGSTNVQASLGDLPPAQIRTLKLAKAQANKHVNMLIARAVTALESWVKQLAMSVAKGTVTSAATTTTPGATGAPPN